MGVSVCVLVRVSACGCECVWVCLRRCACVPVSVCGEFACRGGDLRYSCTFPEWKDTNATPLKLYLLR